MRILSLVVETSVFLPRLRPHLCFILCVIKNPGRKSLMPNLEISFPYLIHCLKRKLSFRFQSMHCDLAVLSVLGSFRFSTKPMYLKVLQLSAQTLTELLLFFNDTKGRNLIYYLLDYCIRLTKMASLPNYVHKTHTCFLPYRFCCVHCVHDIRKVYSVKPTCGQGFLPQRSLVLRKVNYHQSYIV